MALIRTPSIQHVVHVIIYLCWTITVAVNNVKLPEEDPFTKYGSFVAYFSIGIRLLSILIIPQMFMLALGLLLFDIKQPRPELKCSPALAPFLCIRIVTRGLYPTLICQNIKNHLAVANRVGLENFVVEVVTDNELKLDLTDFQRQLFKQTVGRCH